MWCLLSMLVSRVSGICVMVIVYICLFLLVRGLMRLWCVFVFCLFDLFGC